MKKLVLPMILVLISIALSLYFVHVAVSRSLTDLEGVLLQFICLSLGIAGSFIIGKYSAQKAALELIRPHARSAFRRLISLYKSLSSVNELARANDSKPTDQKMALAQISAIVSQQIGTADDALEDWIDIVPEEVEELKQKHKSSTQEENENE